jgi:zeaxanthin epoxidase
VRVFEKTQNYRPFGGPIQVASNAAESIRRIDEAIYEKILARATVIGDRMNGLKDGLSDEWFATFDLDSPARRRGQVSSVVIDRPILQEILLEKVGAHVINGAEVVGAQEVGDRVVVQLSDGSKHEADMLVGSDGIKSRVRDLFDPSRRDPVWSGYTCVAGMAYVVPHDIKEVGYKVWVGPRKYFVSVDVGGGRIQWYAFLNIPPGTVSVDCARLIDWLRTEQFNGWAKDVHLLLDTSPEDEVEQRDLYDRPPDLQWSNGRVCLLGDAAHPMMPNLGQGGGMAIEDALVLGQELSNLKRYGQEPPAFGLRDSIPRALRRYNQNRVLRAAAVQGLSRMSSAFLFQYQPPVKIEFRPSPRIVNFGPRSLITRACQGFLQKVAFPLQFEFLFSFPGEINPEIFAESAAGDYGSWQATESPRRQLVGPRQLGAAERELVSGGMSLKQWFSQYW